MTFVTDARTNAAAPMHGALHRPQDLVVPTVAKRIEAERLQRLQAGQDDAWLVSEWGTAGDPKRALTLPSRTTQANHDPGEPRTGPVRKLSLVEHFKTDVSQPAALKKDSAAVKTEKLPGQALSGDHIAREPRLPAQNKASAESAHTGDADPTRARPDHSARVDREIRVPTDQRSSSKGAGPLSIAPVILAPVLADTDGASGAVPDEEHAKKAGCCTLCVV